MAAFLRNRWPPSLGITGRFPSEWVATIVGIRIGLTGDPWFIPKLRDCRDNLDYAEIRRISTLPQPEVYLEKTIQGLQKAFARAIATLEKEQAAGG